MGIPPKIDVFEISLYVGMTRGLDGVYVGKRVGFGVEMNCAAKVGLMVCVNKGVGVGGGSMIGSSPGEICTTGAYIQPILFGPPG